MSFSPQGRARLQTTLACAGALVLWYWRGGNVTAALTVIAGVLALVAWIAPVRFVPIQRSLDRLLRLGLMGLTWVLLGFVFHFIFLPLGVARRLGGGDPLRRKPRPGMDSYLQSPPSNPIRFDRQY